MQKKIKAKSKRLRPSTVMSIVGESSRMFADRNISFRVYRNMRGYTEAKFESLSYSLLDLAIIDKIEKEIAYMDDKLLDSELVDCFEFKCQRADTSIFDIIELGKSCKIDLYVGLNLEVSNINGFIEGRVKVFKWDEDKRHYYEHLVKDIRKREQYRNDKEINNT